MIFSAQKRAFLYELARTGAATAPQVDPKFVEGAEPERVDRWIRKFYEAPPLAALPAQPRLLNHFMLGADPEFIFADADGDRREASELGLVTGPAFGADNCGRIAELRPAPSRYAVEVVASTLAELRWMWLAKLHTRRFQWLAVPYVGRDGIGGHVHYGRKRPSRDTEVKALDAVTQLLLDLKVFDKQGQARRREGGQYGQWGDWRPQKHGYEYRTMPSWLESPWHAYLTLVLSKLAVFDPELFRNAPTLPPGQKRIFVENVLALYRGRDDDAWLALVALRQLGLPQASGRDIRAAWGFGSDGAMLEPKTEVDLFPASIRPSADDIADVFELLAHKRPLAWRRPVANWPQTKAPEGFMSAVECVSTRYPQIGIGEMLNGLVMQPGLNFSLSAQVVNRPRNEVLVSSDFPLEAVKRAAADLLPADTLVGSSGNYGGPTLLLFDVAHPTTGLRGPQLSKKMREFLLCGLFPVWRPEEANAGSVEKWRATLEAHRQPAVAQQQQRRQRGRVLAELQR